MDKQIDKKKAKKIAIVAGAALGTVAAALFARTKITKFGKECWLLGRNEATTAIIDGFNSDRDYVKECLDKNEVFTWTWMKDKF